MKRPDEKELEKLRATWEDRSGNPVKTSMELEKLAAEYNLEPHHLSLYLGARPGEVYSYLVIAGLEEKVQEAIQEGVLAVSYTIELSYLAPKEQLEFLKFQEGQEAEKNDSLDVFREFIRIRSMKGDRWKAMIPGRALSHLASKAKSYDVLSKKKRAVLFKFGGLRMRGYNLTPKQKHYLDAILDELMESGVILGECFEDPCRICAEIKELIREAS